MVHELIKGREFVLGSASPRRRDLLNIIGIEPLIITANCEEQVDGDNYDEMVLANSHAKNSAVREQYKGRGLVLTADTVVICGDKVIGKPSGPDKAVEHLQMLSGRKHEVKTGIVICDNMNNHSRMGVETTRVFFNSLTAKEIETYIETGEFFDKAGSYGIQGHASQFVSKIEGCYFNVVGLPIALFYNLIKGVLNDHQSAE